MFDIVLLCGEKRKDTHALLEDSHSSSGFT